MYFIFMQTQFPPQCVFFLKKNSCGKSKIKHTHLQTSHIKKQDMYLQMIQHPDASTMSKQNLK